MSIATTQSSSRAVSTTANDVALLVIRLGLGIIFFMHGGQKVFGWFGGPGLDATAKGMAGMGIPTFLAYIAAFTELLGGIAMILGVFSRIAAIGLIVTMSVAIAKVHLANGFFLGGPKPGYEYNVALIAMAIAVLLAGPGKIAIADWEARLFGGSA